MYETPFHNEDLNNYSFLVTGGAGFIGSHIVEYLIKYNAGKVRVIDNLITGSTKNIQQFRELKNFEFIEGDIRNYETCNAVCEGIDYISHQAALGSIPRSLKDPITTNSINVDGYVALLTAAKDAQIKRIIYASSSSVYGDSNVLPKREEIIGNPISPYAVSKYTNELYAKVFALNYGMEIIGLRYFNVFGPRQDPTGAYAAVIPLIIDSLINNRQFYINGDGSQTRDFTFVENVVQANIKALFTDNKQALNQVYNVGVGEKYSLLELYEEIKKITGSAVLPKFKESRKGDIHDSLADISKAGKYINYNPQVKIEKGLKFTVEYFKKILKD